MMKKYISQKEMALGLSYTKIRKSRHSELVSESKLLKK